jgi:hypothetical protein
MRLPLFAEVPDPKYLDGAVLREHRHSEALLDQAPPLRGHRVRRIDDYPWDVESQPAHNGRPEQELQVGPVPTNHVRPDPMHRLDDVLEWLVDADRMVVGSERSIAGSVVVGSDLLRRRDRLAEAEVECLVAEPLADEVRLDETLALRERDVLEQRAPVVVDGQRVPGRAGRP